MIGYSAIPGAVNIPVFTPLLTPGLEPRSIPIPFIVFPFLYSYLWIRKERSDRGWGMVVLKIYVKCLIRRTSYKRN